MAICETRLFCTNVELIHRCEEKLGTFQLASYVIMGMKELSFVSMNDFQSWKDKEETTYAIYVNQQTYHPSSEGMKNVYRHV